MKKIVCVMVAILLAGFTTAQAQSESKTKKAKQTIAEKATKIWNDAKESVSSTAEIIKDELGIKNDRDELRQKYMPIYTRNKYNGGDMYKMVQACRDDFESRYPNCPIVSSVIPQKDWTTIALVDGDTTVGYTQQLCCYVLAKDGEDGYINAEYTFERTKEVGGEYVNSDTAWPSQPRIDVVPAADYEQIK